MRTLVPNQTNPTWLLGAATGLTLKAASAALNGAITVLIHKAFTTDLSRTVTFSAFPTFTAWL